MRLTMLHIYLANIGPWPKRKRKGDQLLKHVHFKLQCTIVDLIIKFLLYFIYIQYNFYLDEEEYSCSLCLASSNLKTKTAEVHYKKKNDFILHIMSFHPTIKYDKLKPKKINECHLCGKSFPGHSALLRHINYHTREKQVSLTII